MAKKVNLLQDKRYSIKDAANILGCSIRQVGRLRDNGTLLFVMIAGRYWITEEILNAYITAQYKEAGII